jgi:hypothetical protein
MSASDRWRLRFLIALVCSLGAAVALMWLTGHPQAAIATLLFSSFCTGLSAYALLMVAIRVAAARGGRMARLLEEIRRAIAYEGPGREPGVQGGEPHLNPDVPKLKADVPKMTTDEAAFRPQN